MTDQVETAAMLIAAIVLLGLPLSAWARELLRVNLPTVGALVILLGLSVVGLGTLVVGHLHLLGPWLPYGLGGLGALVCAIRRRPVVSLSKELLAGVRSQFGAHPVLLSALSIGVALAVVASFAPPFRVDEVEYHWPAPLEWAAAGHWIDSSFRHVDAFPFMEVIYTAAATQRAHAAAHLMHLLTLGALGLGAAGAARALGVRGVAPVAAAAMVMPVAWDSAYVAYNDTAVGALGAAAVAVVLSGRRYWASLALATGLVCVAISIKPTATAAAGLLGLVLLMNVLLGRAAHDKKAATGRLLASWGLVGGAVVATIAFWSVRQHMITGNWIDPAMQASPSTDELSRLPDAYDQLIAPIMPFVLGVVGGQEPWGGRTSLVVQAFLIPALIYLLWARGQALRNFAILALPAWSHWVVLGFVGVRTRFHILSWALLVASVRIGVESAQDRWPRFGRLLEWVWTGTVILGLADVSVEMLKLIHSTWLA